MSTPSVLCLLRAQVLSLPEDWEGRGVWWPLGDHWSLTDWHSAGRGCVSWWLNNTRQSGAGAGRAEHVDNIRIMGLVYLTPQPSSVPGPLWGTGHCFHWRGWCPWHDRGPERGQGGQGKQQPCWTQGNIGYGHPKIVRRRFDIYRRRFDKYRRRFVHMSRMDQTQICDF